MISNRYFTRKCVETLEKSLLLLMFPIFVSSCRPERNLATWKNLRRTPGRDRTISRFPLTFRVT